ncbi:MAG: hypothetical protein GX802_03005 [Clostridiales bacterium]|jgi:hypothetical protein|nr:hypothetical protein [Clostridiales bacterium]
MANKKKKRLKSNPYTVPRRLSWFVLRTVIILIVIVLIALFSFLAAMHAANIYVVVTEGVTLRAACILGDGDINQMYEYFSTEYMDNDNELYDNVYKHYDITNYDYRLTVNSVNIWPWNTTATMTVTERIPSITGTANPDAPQSAVPEWTSAQYVVTCIKSQNRWYITDIITVKVDPPEDEQATPDMSLLTPKPNPTPS